jgi:hypothetical protein
MIRVQGAELAENPRNWREHPDAQRAALTGILQEVGIAGALLAYHSERNHGRLTLIDGHLRKEDYAHLEWPVVVLDVTDAEADALLASHDPLGAMARKDQSKLDDLLADVMTWTQSPALNEMFTKLHSAVPDDEESTAGDEGDPATQFLVLVTCSDEHAQAALLERLASEGWEVKALTS